MAWQGAGGYMFSLRSWLPTFFAILLRSLSTFNFHHMPCVLGKLASSIQHASVYSPLLEKTGTL